jgi:hypothetical protein
MKTDKLLILAVILAACLHPFDAWAAGPRISFQQEIKELDTVPSGQQVTVLFPFSNAGDIALVVEGVEADCGCTEAYSRALEVQPRDHSEIVAVLNTSRLSLGKNERHVYVRCNDPQRPRVTLALIVEVVREPR